MARGKRDSKPGDLIVLVGAYAVFWYVCSATLSEFSVILVGLTTALLWTCFLMPTYCDYRTLQNTPCTRRVRGKLRGCRTHSRSKRDALFAALRMRNPGLVFRVMWSAPGQTASIPAKIIGASGSGTTSPRPTKQSANDVIMLYLTLISTVATVVALFN
jgi:hypothetical protein